MRIEKIVMVAAVLALVCGAAFVTTFDTEDVDADPFTKDNIQYTILTSSTVAVSGWTSGIAVNLTIPSSVTNASVTYSVTKISTGAFAGCSTVTALTIPNSVTTIEENALSGLTGLSSIKFGTGAGPENCGLTLYDVNGSTTITDSSKIIGFTFEKESSKLVRKTVKVTFNMKGHGSAPDPQIVRINNVVSKPTDPTASGYKFIGWYKDSSCTTAWNFSSDKPQNDTDIYAKWAEAWTVTFNYDGKRANIVEVVEKTKSVNAPTAKVTSYTIEGWYKTKNGTTYSDKVTFPYTPTGNTTLYAKLEEVKVSKITITNSSESLIFEKGKTLTITVKVEPEDAKNKTLEYKSSNEAVAKFGTTSGNLNKLTGVAQGKATITVKATDGSNVQTTCEVTILSGEAHAITVNNDGHGTGTPSKATAKYGEEITLTSQPSAGYELLKWESSDVTITNNKFTMPDKAVTVKAVFGISMNIVQAEHGTITGDKLVQIGSSATYSFTPDKDYLLKEIKVDGTVVAEHVATYTLKDITSTHTITAVFEKHEGASSSKDAKGNVTEKYSQDIGDVKLDISETFNVDGTYSSTTSYKDAELGIETKSTSAKDAEGKLTGSITSDVTVANQKKMTDIFKKAQASISSTSAFTGLTTKTMTVNTTTPEGAAKGFDLSFDASTYDGTYGITFKGDAGTIEFDEKAFSTVKDEGKDVRIVLKENKTETMTEIQKWIVEDYQVYEISASGNGDAVHEFDGKVVLTLPLTLKEGETGDDAAIYFVDRFHAVDVGGDYKDGKITAELPHLSYYFAAGAYKESEKSLPSGYDTLVIVLLIVLIIFIALFVIGFVLWFDLDGRQMYFDPGSLLFWRK